MELTKISKIENELGRLLDSAITKNYSIYLFLLGNQTKSTVNSLQNKIEGIINLWTGWSGPKWLKFILFFLAGYAGLYKNNGCNEFKGLILEASIGGLVQIIISKNDIDEKLVHVLSVNGVNPLFIRNIINETDDYLLIEITCDTPQEIDGEHAGYFTILGNTKLMD